MTRLTNQKFAERTGCDFTTASKIRHGKRLPGGHLLITTIFEFGLEEDFVAAGRAYLEGREAFAAYINRTVFDPPAEAPKVTAQTTYAETGPEKASGAGAAEVPQVVFKS